MMICVYCFLGIRYFYYSRVQQDNGNQQNSQYVQIPNVFVPASITRKYRPIIYHRFVFSDLCELPTFKAHTRSSSMEARDPGVVVIALL